jgi:hypothetical protein
VGAKRKSVPIVPRYGGGTAGLMQMNLGFMAGGMGVWIRGLQLPKIFD